MSYVKSVEAAAREAAEAVGAITARREFTISKFGRHADGYLHARVVVHGQPFYFHRRYGSWLAPGTIGGHAVLKEPEGLLGGVLGREVKYALSEKSSPYDTADRRAREAAQEAIKRTRQEDHDGTRSNNASGGSDRLPEGADHRDADDAVRPE